MPFHQKIRGYIRVKIDSDAAVDAAGDFSTASLGRRQTNRYGQPIESAPKSRYTSIMTTKQKVIRAVQNLPGNATYEDAMERLLVLAKIDRGLKQLAAGDTISHEKMKVKMRKWLK